MGYVELGSRSPSDIFDANRRERRSGDVVGGCRWCDVVEGVRGIAIWRGIP